MTESDPKAQMRVLICGSRYWKNYERMFNVVTSLGKIDMIIEGDAKGADKRGRQVAEALNIPCLTFFAGWAIYGDAAGPIRNKRMLEEGKPNIVLAFHDNLKNSKGTANMIQLALERGVPVWHYTLKERTFLRLGD